MPRTLPRVIVCAAASAFALPHAALAQQPAAPPASSATPPAGAASADLDRAKDLFRKGVELMKANDMAGALDHFLRSRAIVPSVPNTMNAAICLDRLDRADEALDLYAQLLTDFAGKVDEDDKRAVTQSMAALRRRVGSVDVSANVDGSLVIDGRQRGRLPLTGPVRVLPGKHAVRVLKDGYAPAEARVEVKLGENVLVDLKLEALAASGRLAVVDDAAAIGLDVVIDGAPVGPAPWEGVLAPGRHVVLLRGKDAGTAPTVANVVVGQIVPLHLRSQPLGAPLRLDPEPSTATLSIDGVTVGRGSWEGRLPVGTHLVEATDEGYITEHAHLDGAARGVIAIKLPIDNAHPRWRATAESHIRVEAHGGYAFGSALGGSAESGCPGACSSRSGPSGAMVGVRGGYVLPNGLVPEVGLGFLSVSTKLSRTVQADPTYAYQLDDAITVDGPYVSGGLGWNLALGAAFEVEPRITIGAFFARSRDAVTGALTRPGDPSSPVAVAGSGDAVRGLDFFAMPAVAARAKLGKVHVGAGFGAAIFLVDGPKLPHGDASVSTPCNMAAPTGPLPLCAISASSQFAGEAAYRRFVLWVPEISVGYTF